MRAPPLIDAAELGRRIDDPGWRVLDCRFDLSDSDAGRQQWLEGHLPGAAYAHLDDDLAGPITASSGRHPLPDPAQFTAFLGRVGIGNDATVAVYDAGSGAIAARAWWLLRWLGHDSVRLLDGGLAAWREAGLPLQHGIVEREPTTFVGTPRSDSVLTTADIERRMQRGEPVRLVDARDAARFRGEIEPLDAVAGHIPGSRNLPFVDTVGPDGRFRPAAELAALWRRAVGDAPTGDWGVMCGSGVTACHLVVSARLAGREEPRLYVGSWSEWIRDPSRRRSRSR